MLGGIRGSRGAGGGLRGGMRARSPAGDRSAARVFRRLQGAAQTESPLRKLFLFRGREEEDGDILNTDQVQVCLYSTLKQLDDQGAEHTHI